MGAAVKGRAEVSRGSRAGQQRVTVEISGLAFEAMQGAEAGSAMAASKRMALALRFYLGDRGTARPAWPYPSFLRGSETQADVPVQFDVEADLWREFETEASAQGVSVDQLAEHVAFYFAAEANAGNLSQRILDDLGQEDGE